LKTACALTLCIATAMHWPANADAMHGCMHSRLCSQHSFAGRRQLLVTTHRRHAVLDRVVRHGAHCKRHLSLLLVAHFSGEQARSGGERALHTAGLQRRRREVVLERVAAAAAAAALRRTGLSSLPGRSRRGAGQARQRGLTAASSGWPLTSSAAAAERRTRRRRGPSSCPWTRCQRPRRTASRS